MPAKWRPKIKRSIRENAASVVPRLFEQFIAHREKVLTAPRRTDRLHKMRIAGKPLRYGMETFQPIFGPAFQRCFSEVKELIERMGILHDYDVAIPILREHLSELQFFNRKTAGREEKFSTRPIRTLIEKLRSERERAFGELEKKLKRWERENFLRKIEEAVK